MQKMFIVLLSVFVSFEFALAQGPGLSGGELFEAQEVEGRVSVRCQSPQGSDFAVYYCSENILLPGEWDRFVHPDKVEGDEVTLVSHQESGKVRTKTKDYDATSGKSKNFNLWIATLFQRPLLDYGLNRIDYEVTKRGIVQDMGSFDVTVEQSSEPRQCRSRTYFSSNLSDCRSGGYNICQRYFRDLNYCL